MPGQLHPGRADTGREGERDDVGHAVQAGHNRDEGDHERRHGVRGPAGGWPRRGTDQVTDAETDEDDR
jgi:hypothetical protein